MVKLIIKVKKWFFYVFFFCGLTHYSLLLFTKLRLLIKTEQKSPKKKQKKLNGIYRWKMLRTFYINSIHLVLLLLLLFLSHIDFMKWLMLSTQAKRL